jgi:glycosyltransferase
MNNIIVSIITTVKNGEKTIVDALQSVNSQTYKSIEHIVVDAASTDKTLDLINKNIKDFSLVISEADNGIYDGINKGILRSGGDIIGILHSDDFFAYNEVIEDIVNEFAAKDINFLFADLDYVERENQDKIFRRWISGLYSSKKLAFGWMPPHPTIFFKKSLADELGLYDLRFNISSDYDFMLRYLLNPRVNVGYIPKIITKMRAGGISNKSIANILRKSIEDYKILKIHNVGGVCTLLLKNLRKLTQFFPKNN